MDTKTYIFVYFYQQYLVLFTIFLRITCVQRVAVGETSRGLRAGERERDESRSSHTSAVIACFDTYLTSIMHQGTSF